MQDATDSSFPTTSLYAFSDVMHYDLSTISRDGAVAVIDAVHTDRYVAATRCFVHDFLLHGRLNDSVHPLTRMTKLLNGFIALPTPVNTRRLLIDVPKSCPKDMMGFFSYLTGSFMFEWVSRFMSSSENKQQWITQEIVPGISGAECHQLWFVLSSHIDKVFEGGIPLDFESIVSARNSQLKCDHHFRTFGYMTFFDDIKMTSAVKAYNPMRAKISYFQPGKGWEISLSHYDVCFDQEGLVTHFRIPNRRTVNLSKFLLPSDIVKLATSMNDDDDYLGYDVDPSDAVVVGNLSLPLKLDPWILVHYLTRIFKTYGRVDIHVLHAGIVQFSKGYDDVNPDYHDVSISDEVSITMDGVFSKTDLTSWTYLCLGIQWFADAANAALGRFYPDPVLSRLQAVAAFDRYNSKVNDKYGLAISRTVSVVEYGSNLRIRYQ